MSEEERDNVFKISVPIITNEELERLNHTIENDLDSIVHQISETVSRDRDIIILKKVIENQQKEIEELKNADLTIVYMNGFYDGQKKIKDKIKAKIEELKQKQYILSSKDSEIEILQSLLKEE